MIRFTRTTRLFAAAGIAALALAGCSNAPAAAPAGDQKASEAPAEAMAALSFGDPWVKATEGSMTAVFAEIENESGEDVTIVSAEVEGAGMTQLHETVVQSDGSSTMQELKDGLVVPAGGEVELEPGGSHIMAMDLTKPIMPGDEVKVTVKLSDGSELEFTAVAKEYTGAEETYAPGHGDDMDDHAGHDHGDDMDDHAGHDHGDDMDDHAGHDHGDDMDDHAGHDHGDMDDHGDDDHSGHDHH